MLRQAQRTTILELNGQGVSKREIARVLEISRIAVRKVRTPMPVKTFAVYKTARPEPGGFDRY